MLRLEVVQSLKLMREVVRLQRLPQRLPQLRLETIVTGRSRALWLAVAQSLSQMQEVEPRRQLQPQPRPEAIATGKASRELWRHQSLHPLAQSLYQLMSQHRLRRQLSPETIATGRSRAK